MNPEKLGSKLKELRELYGLSRKTIEEKYNIPVSSLRVWEEGKKSISVENLMNVITIFRNYGMHISLDWLLANEISADPLNKIIKILFNSKDFIFYANKNFNIIHISPKYSQSINIEPLPQTITKILANSINALLPALESAPEYTQLINRKIPLKINNTMVDINLVPYFENLNEIMGYFGFIDNLPIHNFI